jgi:hypothetical protein
MKMNEIAESARAEFVAAFGEEKGTYWFDALVFVKDLADSDRLKLEAAEQDLADERSSATHEAESLRQHIEDAHKAMGVIASSYAAEPYQDDETIPGTSLPTNRRIAREFLTYELPGDDQAGT